MFGDTENLADSTPRTGFNTIIRILALGFFLEDNPKKRKGGIYYSILSFLATFTIRNTINATTMKVIRATKKSPIPND